MILWFVHECITYCVLHSGIRASWMLLVIGKCMVNCEWCNHSCMCLVNLQKGQEMRRPWNRQSVWGPLGCDLSILLHYSMYCLMCVYIQASHTSICKIHAKTICYCWHICRPQGCCCRNYTDLIVELIVVRQTQSFSYYYDSIMTPLLQVGQRWFATMEHLIQIVAILYFPNNPGKRTQCLELAHPVIFMLIYIR